MDYKFPEKSEILKYEELTDEAISKNKLLQEQQIKLLIGGPTVSKILENLYLGRAKDTEQNNPILYDLVICATNAEENLNESFYDGKTEIFQLPLLTGQKFKDVGIDSFQYKNQYYLHKALFKIDNALINNKNVLVCCQQGKDRSALIILCYIKAKYDINEDQAWNFVKNKRLIITTKNIKEYWNFFTKEFIEPKKDKITNKILDLYKDYFNELISIYPILQTF